MIYFILTFTATRILRVVEKKIDGPSAYARLDDTDTAVSEEK